MVVPDEIRKCVCFIGLQMADGSFHLKGTAFFVTRPAQTVPDRSFAYAVTAKHVVAGIKATGVDSVFLRMNLKNSGATWAKTDIKSWIVSATDTSIDVAVMPLVFDERFDHKAIPIGMFADSSTIEKERIGAGDEIFVTGLFVHHAGQKQNIPIVRTGNIAAMPHEKVSTRLGEVDAYLIEARSIGGLSGSPVFVSLGGLRHGTFEVRGGPAFYALGLMHGHFDLGSASIDDGDAAKRSSAINVGIGIVVPIEKVAEVINQPSLTEMREIAEARERESNLPDMD